VKGFRRQPEAHNLLKAFFLRPGGNKNFKLLTTFKILKYLTYIHYAALQKKTWFVRMGFKIKTATSFQGLI